MSTRVSIGGASYNLTLEDRQFVRQLQTAERTAQQRAATIRRNLASLPLGHPDVERFRRDLQRAEAEAARAAAQIRQRLGQIGPAASAASRVMSNSFVAGFGSMVAASAGLFTIINTLKGIATAGQEAANAQRALNAQFGASAAGNLATFTDQLATATARSRTEAKQAAAITATLARNYGFTAEEIRTVIAVSNDLAAVSGKGLADATQRVTAALRGETESSEALGLSLQVAALKGSDTLNASEKKRLETMGNVEGAHVRLRVLLEQSAFAQGEAALQAEEGANNFAKLAAATANLNTTMGESSSIGAIPGMLAKAATSAENLIRILDILNEREQIANRLRAEAQAQQGIGGAGSGPLELTTDMASNLNKIAELIGKGTVAQRDFWKEAEIVQREAMAAATATTTMGGVIAGLNTTGAQQQLRDLAAEMKDAAAAGQALAAAIADDHEKLARRQDVLGGVAGFGPTLADIKEQNAEIAKAEKASAEQRAKNAVAIAKSIHDVRIKEIDAEIDAAERERDGRIQAAEDVRDGILEALEDERQAYDDRVDAALRAAEVERDGRIEAAEAAHEAQVALLQEQAKIEQVASAQRLRDLDRARDGELAAQEAIRDAEVARLGGEKTATDAARQQQDRALQDRLTAEDRAREDLREGERRALQATQADADQRQAFIEETRDTALAAIEAEEDARRDQSDATLRALDEQLAAEQRRHADAIAHIDREEQAATAALQRRLDALDAAEQRAQDREQGRSLRQNVREARSGLRSARESGDPEEIRQAEQAAAQAREAVRSAADQKAAAAARLRIQEQIAAVQKEAEARTQAEAEALAAATARIEAEKVAEQERLTVALEALAARATATKAASEIDLANLAADTALEQAAYAERTLAAQTRYQAEDRAREDGALVAARLLADTRALEDQHYADGIAAAQSRYDDEAERITVLYDDPEQGLIAKEKQAGAAIAERFDLAIEAANTAYTNEREQAQETYDQFVTQTKDAQEAEHRRFEQAIEDANRAYENQREQIEATATAHIDGLKLQKEATDTRLAEMEKRWASWKDATVEAIDAAIKKVDELGQAIGALPTIPVPGSAGSTSGGIGGAALTAPQSTSNAELRAQFEAAGLSASAIAAACGPIAAAGLAEAFGNAAEDIDPGRVAREAGAAGAWNTSVGVTDFSRVAAAAGVSVSASSQAVALDALKKGQPVVINQSAGGGFPGHYLLAQGIDEAGNIDIGNTGAAVGMGRYVSLSQIASKGGGLRYYTANPTAEQQQRLQGRSGGAAPRGGGDSIPSPNGEATSAGTSPAAVAAYIKQRAEALGYVNPSAAVAVWTGEGSVTDSGQSNFVYRGARERSYGPFQLNYDGGEGNTFTAQTGIQPGDPRFERASIDYALERALQTGWVPWHGSPFPDPWYGITRMARGGVIDRETILSDAKTGKAYGVMGEAGPEVVTPLGSFTRGADGGWLKNGKAVVQEMVTPNGRYRLVNGAWQKVVNVSLGGGPPKTPRVPGVGFGGGPPEAMKPPGSIVGSAGPIRQSGGDTTVRQEFGAADSIPGFDNRWESLACGPLAAHSLIVSSGQNVSIGEVAGWSRNLWADGITVQDLSTIVGNWGLSTASVNRPQMDSWLQAGNVGALMVAPVPRLPTGHWMVPQGINEAGQYFMGNSSDVIFGTPWMSPEDLMGRTGARERDLYYQTASFDPSLKKMARGGIIPRPSVISDRATGQPWGLVGESGPEIVAPMGSGGGSGDLYLSVSVGGRVLEDYTITVMDRAQRDGRFRVVPRA